MSFLAKYDGVCEACGVEFEEGDLITYNYDDEIVHDECDD